MDLLIFFDYRYDNHSKCYNGPYKINVINIMCLPTENPAVIKKLLSVPASIFYDNILNLNSEN